MRDLHAMQQIEQVDIGEARGLAAFLLDVLMGPKHPTEAVSKNPPCLMDGVRQAVEPAHRLSLPAVASACACTWATPLPPIGGRPARRASRRTTLRQSRGNHPRARLGLPSSVSQSPCECR